jgi:hypothetical protein
MARVLTLAFFILFSLPAIGEEKPKAVCETATLLAQIFKVQPDQIPWKVDLRPHCNISDQGSIGSCWANSGLEVYDQWFHKAGELQKTEHLSKDYYAGIHIWEGAMGDFSSEGLITAINEGGSVEYFQNTLFKAGFVLEKDFQFPKINGKSIRESKEIHAEFYTKLNEAKTAKDPELFRSVLEKYLGKLGEVPAIEPERGFSSKFFELTYSKEDAQFIGYENLESKITQTLDYGLPVTFGIHQFGTRLRSAKRTSHIFGGAHNPLTDNTGGHAMNIIGYHLNQNGKVDFYLIENSWGKEFGTEGTSTISAKYLYQQTKSYAIPNVK